jgi:hypothetical protein
MSDPEETPHGSSNDGIQPSSEGQGRGEIVPRQDSQSHTDSHSNTSSQDTTVNASFSAGGSNVRPTELHLNPIIKEYKGQELWLRKKSLDMIEVLIESSESRKVPRHSSRRLPTEQRNSDSLAQSKPYRVRIRSALLVEFLMVIANTPSNQHQTQTKAPVIGADNGITSKVFLYPFKLFVRFEKEIRQHAEWLSQKFSTPERMPVEHEMSQKFPEYL